MDDSCAVCAETLEWVAYGPCGHREVCSTCVARLRFICDDRRCCICKTESDQVFVTKALGDYTRVINDFSVLPADLKEGRVGQYWYHEDTQAVFDDSDHYMMIQAMCKLSCSVCDNDESEGSRRRIKFKNVEQLKGHLFHQHRLVMCSLCLEGRKVFICEQKLYTRTQLNRHTTSGDSEVDGTESERGGFAGHPACEFCKTHFYGDNELYSHMSTEHYTCHICQRQHPGQYEYYKNYDDLEIHFRREHFLCEDEACLAKKFVVFHSEAEMKRHNAMEHGGNMSRSKRIAALQIPTSFRYQRSNEQDNRQGRRRSFRREFPEDQLSMAIQASYETANAGVTCNNSSSSSGTQAVSARGERVDVDPIVQPFESLAVSDSDQPTRYRQAVSQNSSNAPLEESSFPPLPVAPRGSQQNPKPEAQRNTMAANLRRKNKSSATSKSAQAWPAVNRSPIMPAASPANTWSTASAAATGSSSSSGQNKSATNNGPAASSYPSLARAQPASIHGNSQAWPTSSAAATGSSSSSGQNKTAANHLPAASSFPSLARAQPASTHGNSQAWPTASAAATGSSSSPGPATNNGPAASSYSSLARVQPASSHGTSPAESSRKGSTNKINHSTSAPNLADISSFDPSTSDFPPVSVSQVRKLSTSAQGVPKVGDVHSANKSLVERIRTALEFDESKYTEFKEISGKYRQGLMDAESYLAYVYQYGLSHLVIELARLCPDIEKQKELIDTYNYNAQFVSTGAQKNDRSKGGNHTSDGGLKKGKGKWSADEDNHSKPNLADSIMNSVRNLQASYKFADEEVEVLSKDGYRNGKGKSKIVVDEQQGVISCSSEPSVKLQGKKYESHSDGGGGGGLSNQSSGGGKNKQQRKKTSKFHRVRLGDGSVAALLDLRNNVADSNLDEEEDASSDGKKNGNEGGGLPVRGVWRNGGGQKLMGRAAGGDSK